MGDLSRIGTSACGSCCGTRSDHLSRRAGQRFKWWRNYSRLLPSPTEQTQCAEFAPTLKAGPYAFCLCSFSLQWCASSAGGIGGRDTPLWAGSKASLGVVESGLWDLWGIELALRSCL